MITFRNALLILMKAAENDVRGSGMGYRSTSTAWREEVQQAWSIVFRRVHKRDPDTNDRYNAGM